MTCRDFPPRSAKRSWRPMGERWRTSVQKVAIVFSVSPWGEEKSSDSSGRLAAWARMSLVIWSIEDRIAMMR